MNFTRAISWGVLFLVSSCASLSSGDEAEPTYASEAEENIRLGNEAMAAQSFIEAGKYFEHVRSKFPFLEAARTASLRLADLDFEREQYLEARDRYRSFIKQYPTHPKVDYAAFRAAYTYYKEIPSDFFILPPPEQKEQMAVKSTLAAMTDFIGQYPESSHVEEAKKIIQDVRLRLAKHEMSVAQFYTRQKRWPAVVSRLRVLLQNYPDVGLQEEAYERLYEALIAMDRPEEAKGVLEEIIKAMPGTKAAQKAQRLLAP